MRHIAMKAAFVHNYQLSKKSAPQPTPCVLTVFLKRSGSDKLRSVSGTMLNKGADPGQC